MDKVRPEFYIGVVVILALIFAWWVVEVYKPNQRNVLAHSRALRNINYCDNKNQNQTLDLYKPKKSHKGKIPLIVYVHGGGWRTGNKNNSFIMNTWGNYFVKKGMAVATVNYRMNTKTPYPDINMDIACALSYLNTNADNLNLDENRVIFLGDSAGAQIISLAALHNPYSEYKYKTPKGVIAFYGVSDFSKILTGSHPDYNARRYLGKDYLGKAQQASPINYVSEGSPQFLLFHGDKDTVVPQTQSKYMYDALLGKNVRATFVNIPEAGHAFVGPELGIKRYETIKKHINIFLKQTINLK